MRNLRCHVGATFRPRGAGQRYCDAHSGVDFWALDNPEKAAASQRKSQRRYRHKKAHGDPDIYDRLLAEQGCQCAICGREPGPGMHLAIDHCHTSSAIRALLCPRCNTGLGYFEDDTERLRAAAAYLERHRV